MKEKKLSAFVVAATYIGTVVGAGFASGQEVLQFFAYFGPVAFVGLFLSTLLFMFFGWQILLIGNELQADSHLAVIRYFTGKKLGTFIDIVITFFLFGALTLMAAGAGAIFEEQFNLSPLLGSIAIILITFVTVALGIGSVIKSISYVVPLLLTAVLVVSISVISSQGVAGLTQVKPIVANAAVGNWFLAAVLYVSYNLVLAVAVLAPLGKEAGNKQSINKGALLGGLGLGIGATVIVVALLLTRDRAATFDVPMIFLAGLISPLIRTLYSGVLFAEVYTTAVGALYGFSARLASTGSRRVWYAAGASVGAFALSRIGFVNLIRFLLPAVGYVGLLMLGGIAYKYLQRQKLVSASVQPAFKPNPQRDEE